MLTKKTGNVTQKIRPVNMMERGKTTVAETFVLFEVMMCGCLTIFMMIKSGYYDRFSFMSWQRFHGKEDN